MVKGPPEVPGARAEEEGEWEYYYEDVEERGKVVEKEVVKEGAKEQQQEGWECPVCTLLNPLDRPGCMACTTERPAQLGAGAAGPAQLGAGAAGPVQLGEEADQLGAAAGPPTAGRKEGGLDAYKQLENLDVIPNAETFECLVCFLEIEPGDGAVLRECLHTFCRLALDYSPKYWVGVINKGFQTEE